MTRVARFTALSALLLGLSLAARAQAEPQQVAAPHAAPVEADHEHQVPTFDDINWYYGVLGEKEGVEPSLLYRPKGMPVPFGAMLFNSAVLFYVLIRFGRKPVVDGLRMRKQNILRSIEEAQKMRAEAEASLAEYEEKLAKIEEEVTRVRDEMRAAGESERKRILAEARDKRARMERDARVLIEQELKAAREQLMAETVHNAVRAAEIVLQAQITSQDHSRLAEEHLAGLKTSAVALRGKS
jgi:F-type H+-transporting ATPase subunit b